MKRSLVLPVVAVLALAAAGSGLYLAYARTEAPPPAIAAATETGPEKVFNAESFTLENGMQVVVIPNHRAPVVTHMVWYKVGAADDPAKKSGIAHFLEHLMFKGTATVPPGEFSRIVRSLGGNDNAFTSQDYTAYFQSISVEHLPKMMEMEADRMRGLLLPEDDVKSERDVVVEERRQRTENDPRGYFMEQMASTLFLNHPYGNPPIGWYSEVDALNRTDAKAFYDQWYAPNNAILVVSGDMTAAQLKPLAEETYGKLEPRAMPERNWTSVPPLLGLPKLTLHHPSIHQQALFRIYRVPSATQNKAESLALQVLAQIMDGGAATRLYKSLVVDQKLASGVSLSYDAGQISDSKLWIQALPAPGVNLDTLDAAISAELRKLVKDGVTAEELRDAKERMKDAAIYARDSLQGPAMAFGAALASGESIDDVEYWPSNIDKVTAAQIHDAAASYLDPDDLHKRPYVTGYLLPEEKQQ